MGRYRSPFARLNGVVASVGFAGSRSPAVSIWISWCTSAKVLQWWSMTRTSTVSPRIMILLKAVTMMINYVPFFIVIILESGLNSHSDGMTWGGDARNDHVHQWTVDTCEYIMCGQPTCCTLSPTNRRLSSALMVLTESQEIQGFFGWNKPSRQ